MSLVVCALSTILSLIRISYQQNLFVVFLGYARYQRWFKCYSHSLQRFFVSADVTFFEEQPFYPRNQPDHMPNLDSQKPIPSPVIAFPTPHKLGRFTDPPVVYLKGSKAPLNTEVATSPAQVVTSGNQFNTSISFSHLLSL